MPQPVVVDSGAAETITPRTLCPNQKTAESEGSDRELFQLMADGSTMVNEKEKTLSLSTADGHKRKVTFRVANVNKVPGSVSKMVRNGNRLVFDTSGSFIENKVKKNMLWSEKEVECTLST